MDTLKELFEGNEPLFEGLDVHDRWDWSVRHPVVRLDFSGRNFTEPGHLDTNLTAQLDGMERRAGVGTLYPAGPETVRPSDRDAARAHGTAHGRAGRRVRQADPGCPGEAGAGPRQSRCPARAVLGHQVQRRARQVHAAHGREQVLQGGHLLRPEQPHRHHAGPGVLRHLRLHGTRPGHRVRAGAPGPGPRRDPPLVQRLWLAGQGEGLQPFRHPAPLPAARVQGPLVRDRGRRGSSSTPCCAAASPPRSWTA